jgi:ferredoxin
MGAGLFRISKIRFNDFLDSLAKSCDLYAPVKTDAVRFQKISRYSEIYLERNSDFPVKEFFFKERQKLFSFHGNKIDAEIEKPGKRIFFGLRRCDLNAVRHQDFIFMDKHKDPYYTANRQESILLGYHCNSAPSKYCFCGSMDLIDYYDAMFWDRGEYLLAHAATAAGEETLKKGAFLPTGEVLGEDHRKIDFTDRLQKKDISGLHDNPDWKKGVDRCISCAACTTLCPTCYCHEIKDEISLDDLKSGERVREWSSCQLKSFTRVAGDHIFRDKREDRFKHRIYHQLQYFKERYNIQMCVGCGRCITHCPTEIDFVQIINEMKDEAAK